MVPPQWGSPTEFIVLLMIHSSHKHVDTECDDLPFITLIRIVSPQLDLVSFLLLLLAVYRACEKWLGVWIIY